MPTELEALAGEAEFSTPFVLFAGGLPHLVATDKSWLLGQQKRGLKGRKYPGDVETENRVAGWFTLPVPETRYDREGVIVWCDTPGDPPYGDDDPAGMIDNVKVSRKRLARLLSVMEGDYVHLWCVTNEVGVEALALASEDHSMRGVLAGYVGDHTYKLFGVPPAGDVFDLMLGAK